MKMLVKRVYAGLIDMIFVGIIVYILYCFYFYYGMKIEDFNVNLDWLNLEYRIVMGAAMFVYYIICELFNFSVGKKVFKIKIDYGNYPKSARFFRPVFKMILLYVPVIFVISVFFERHLLYYDYILKTDIVPDKYERSDLR